MFALPLNITRLITVIGGRPTAAANSGREGSKDTERDAERDGGAKMSAVVRSQIPRWP